MGYCFGIDIGGTTVKIGLLAEDGALLEGWEIPTRREPTPEGLLLDIRVSILDRLDRGLDGGKKQKIRRADILGIGMAAPGAVTADGILHGAVNIGWGDVALAEEAERILGISPVCVGNDARLAALGEAAYGAGVGARSMLMVTLGTGVGGGVVLNGKVLMGESGVAGEIGHMTVNPFETVRCNCGKTGCLEQYAFAKRREDSLLRQKEITAKTLWDAAKAGDVLANEITDAVSAYLGMALANAMYLVDTEKIVFGGGVSKAGELLLQKVEKAYRSRVFAHSREKEFLLAKLGNAAGMRGAAALLLQKIR